MAACMIWLSICVIWPVSVYGCDWAGQCPLLEIREPLLKGQYIAELQELLKHAGYYQGPVDGCYHRDTAEGVKKFQKECYLEVDGTVGPKTWAALAELCAQPVGGKTLNPGPKGNVSIVIDANRLQLQVLDDGKLFKTYPVAIGKSSTPSPIGEFKVVSKGINWGTGFGTRWMGLNVPWGIYGIHGTNKPGSIGTAASHGCFRMFNQHVEEIFPWVPVGTRVRIIGNTPKFRGFSRSLKIKDSGQDVAFLQYRLGELGFSVDAADARFGRLTEFAVKMFEAYHMLPVDGIADQEMLKYLDDKHKNNPRD